MNNKTNTISIDALAIGSYGIIKEFHDKVVGSRLIDLGLFPGKKIKVLRKAPFGGALYIKSGQQSFALGLTEAKTVFATPEVI
ncbi:FeoA family protein [Flammeovirga kamogawensis]|uniref:Ferrous iron transport protein A n=1 Tax=Flammeovirga kamogawensis TaxID=373891 RepID=A0ABX8H103_9BACT|nr:FeoA family protein [Flammeovirga kamogawensis]MBB6459439.1 ferrous iron transport protein A [Flammeovirga kamogawensis]QWG08992.1 ferrous iron transport protein A [Flammeovirga kamogawensis]TRX67283.1 ferrous iron transport protein A [Flammeovirga kamogawensis]